MDFHQLISFKYQIFSLILLILAKTDQDKYSFTTNKSLYTAPSLTIKVIVKAYYVIGASLKTNYMNFLFQLVQH